MTGLRGSGLEIGREFAAVFGEFAHDFGMQPDVHRCGIIGVAGEVQLMRKFEAGIMARIHVEQLQHVNDGDAPVEIIAMAGFEAVEHRGDIDGFGRGGGGCIGRRCGIDGGGWFGGFGAVEDFA